VAHGDRQEPVQQPVGDLDAADVVGELGGGDVADHGQMGGGGPSGGGAGEQGKGPCVPRRAQHR